MKTNPKLDIILLMILIPLLYVGLFKSPLFEGATLNPGFSGFCFGISLVIIIYLIFKTYLTYGNKRKN